MKKSSPVVLFVAFFSILVCDAAPKPNIVFIMADDLGVGDVADYTRTFTDREVVVPTPTMDSLAKSGMWFTDAHSSTALCSPTRYCVMSGNHNYRSYAKWGVWGTFRKNAISPEEATLGTVAQAAGYKTGFFGKWHLGGDFVDKKTGKIFRGDDRGDPDTTVDATHYVDGGPSTRGFEYSFTLPCGVQGPIYIAYENDEWYPLEDGSKIIYTDEKSATFPKVVSDKGPGLGDSNWDTREIGKVLSAKAVDFINDNAGEKPFFMCYWSPTVHLPHCPPEEFDGLKIANTTPSHHTDMIRDLDQQIARIVAALKKNGVYENTLIVVTSDNGGLNVNAKTRESGHISSGIYRSFKNSPYEGGHRVPFFVVWEGVVEAGQVEDELVVNHDMLGTMAELLNVQVPDDQAMDSYSFLSLLKGSKYHSRKHVLLQSGSKQELMLREGSWKLIIDTDHKLSFFEPIALFDLDKNPTEDEKQNLINHPKFKQRVDQMLKDYLDIRNSKARTAVAG